VAGGGGRGLGRGERAATPRQLVGGLARAFLPVARLAFRDVHGLALPWRSAPRREARAARRDADIPGRNFLRRRGPAESRARSRPPGTRRRARRRERRPRRTRR